ncbi:hypothetical protein FB451DRAFT_1340523 [Mycena latifolia]|nr:hypothetical protein FB451DRAFT_1340523 [Mycena latifolia]
MLTEGEMFWRDQVWLKDCRAGIIDARCVKDGVDVCLKWIDASINEEEHEIEMFLCSGPLANDPRNRCVPILEALQFSDDEKSSIIIMPLLREYSDPGSTPSAKRDCNGSNIMMDGSKMFPDGFYPMSPKLNHDFYSGRAKFYIRTQRSPKCYIIDFGLSRRYETGNAPPLEAPIHGGDKSTPEFRFKDGHPSVPCDPFSIDVYFLGNMILKDFIEVLIFVGPLSRHDPAKRPTMDEVVERFAVIRSSLSSWKLCSRVVEAGASLDPAAP